MRCVVVTGPGVLELNFMWLPTIIGMNSIVKQDIEKHLADKLQGLPLDEAGLNKAHDVVVAYLIDKFPEMEGLGRFLDGMKYLELRT